VHEAEQDSPSLPSAAPPEADTITSGTCRLDRPPGQRRGDFFSHHRAHRPAHEVEIHHRDVERHAVQTARSRSAPPRAARLLPWPSRGAAVVLEVEGSVEWSLGVELVPGTSSIRRSMVLLGGNPAMVPSQSRAHIQGADEPVLDVDTCPHSSHFSQASARNLQLDPFGRAGLTLFFEPGHCARHSGGLEGRQFVRGPPAAPVPDRVSRLSELGVARLSRLHATRRQMPRRWST